MAAASSEQSISPIGAWPQRPPGDLRPGRRYLGLNDFGATLDMKDIDIIGTFAAELHCPPPLAALSILL
jgi:hypothetical protein